VKQLLQLPDSSDEVTSLEVCCHYLVVSTHAGAVKLFDLSRRSDFHFSVITVRVKVKVTLICTAPIPLMRSGMARVI